jgi:EmrB/QacA subfamily drug resistance transporter
VGVADPPSGSTTASIERLDPALLKLGGVVILGAIASILDTTIVNVALDTVARDFHTSLSTIQWVSTGYLLALAVVIPLSGWSVERYGAKPMWMLSLILFVIGSALSGAAWSANSLIAFRVIQGLGGGMMMPIAQTILAQAAGPARLGRVMSMVAIPGMLAPILGPVIGGLIIDSASWRWIFYVNVPIVAVALIAAWKGLPGGGGHKVHRLDVVGFVLISPGLALGVYGFSQAGNHGGFSSTSVIIPLFLSVVLLGTFVHHSLHTKTTPLIDVRLFKDRYFSASAGTSLLLGAALFGGMILLPLYYQIVRGESPLAAGLQLAPQGIGVMVASVMAGRLTDRIGAGRVVPIGLVVTLAGTFVFTQLTAHTNQWVLAGSLVVRGLGLGSSMFPAMAAAYNSLPRSAVPRATTAINILQRVGGSLGTAALIVILDTHMAAVVGSTAVTDISATSGTPPPVVAAGLAGAFGSTFWWVMGITALALVPALFLPRHRAGHFADETPVPGSAPALSLD